MEQSPNPILNIATFGPRKPVVLGSAENNSTTDGHRVDPNDSKVLVAAEKRFATPPRSFARSIKSPTYDDENSYPSPQNVNGEKTKPSDFPIIHHCVTATHQRHKVDKARQRPSVGGKSVAAMRHLNKAGSHKRGANGRQLSTEQLKMLSRRIDPSAPLSSPHASPSKPALPQSLSQHVHHTPSTPIAAMTTQSPSPSAQSSLFQTCTSIWSGPQPQLADLHYTNIKLLSELLKTRLSQAKYRALASLDPSLHCSEDELDIGSLHLLKRRKPIQLTNKRHQLALAVSGSGRNLFERKDNHQHHRSPSQPLPPPRLLQPALRQEEEGGCGTLMADGTGKLSASISQQQAVIPTKGRKVNAGKRKLAAERTPKRSYSNKTISPVVLEDGSRVFVCEPCGKRYKNRNGLTYHLDRCQYRQEERENSQQQDELVDEDHGNEFNCICNTPTEDRGTMIQCDKCQAWQHTECVGLEQNNAPDDYVCAQCFCNEDSESSQRDTHAEMEEEEDELEDDDDSACDQPADAPPVANETAVTRPIDEDIFLPFERSDLASVTTGEWDDDNIQQQATSEPWVHVAANSQEDTPFSSVQDPAFHSWSMSDLGLINPPSLLFSDSTTFDDDNNLPPSDIVPTDASPTDALWFEFANFEDDYHCDEL